MSPESKPAARSFVLLCSDANFSRAVMRALARRRMLPQLVALPEFAPAPNARARSSHLLEPRATRNFPPEYDNIEFVYVPASQQKAWAARLRQREFDFILVACWPYLLQSAVLDAVECAALNLHPSLLPAYRGADPIGAQLEAGDSDFGVTLHLLDCRFDHGDIIAQQVLPPADAAPARARLEQQCAESGADLFVNAVQTWPEWRRRHQPD